MASSPITSWEIVWETVETVSDFVFLGSKITADVDCSHEIKRRLLLGRKVMTNLDSIFKSRDITLPTKVCLVKPMVFPVVMYECESWTIKKAETIKLDYKESITMNKASGGDGIPVELFQNLKDDAVKVLHSICQQIWKTQVSTGLEKVSFHSNPKERQCQRMFKLLND